MSSMHIWQGIPRHTREYIRQELADNGIDIEQVLATAGTPSNHICAPEEKFLSIREAGRNIGSQVKNFKKVDAQASSRGEA